MLAVTVAVGALAASPAQVHAAELTVAKTAQVAIAASALTGPGVLEQRSLALHGIPVRGAYDRVWIGADGRERMLISRRPVGEPALLPAEASVTAAQVPAIAQAYTAGPEPTAAPELVYRMVLGEPVLVWEIQMPLVIDPEPSRMLLWVSAATGRVLDEREQVFASRARVFAENPAVTPDPIEVELDIDAQGPGVPLIGPRVAALNCVSEPPTEEETIYPWHSDVECYGVEGLVSDVDGNYFPALPEIIYPEQSQVADDEYAQLSMYYHAQRFFDRFAELGVESFACERSTMLANFHDIEPSGALEYTPLNNAFYTNQCNIEDGPTMIFGQGSEVDYGYDGDVVYHELGHGLVAHLAPDGLTDPQLRSDASLLDARAINEALADYFSVVLTDDPLLAEYVGRFSSSSRNYIRDAQNQRTCPAHMNGQEHNDGEPFMAALWATRKRVGGALLDPMVLQMLMRLPGDASLEQAATTLLEVADEAVAAGTMGASDRAVLGRALASRGLTDCPRVLADPARVEAGATMYLRRRTGGGQPFYPGPSQLRYEVPADAREAFVRFKLVAKGSAKPVQARILVKRADAPIEYAYRLVAVDEEVELPEDDGEPDEPDPVREVILTTGDWDTEIDPVQYATNEYEGRIADLSAGEVIYVALVNLATTTAVASSVRIQTDAAVPEDADDGEESGGSDGPAPDGAEIVMSDQFASGGCTCRTPARGAAPRGGVGPGWLGLLLLPLLRRRERRTANAGGC